MVRYTEEQKITAVRTYYKTGRSYSKTIQALGYPEIQALRQWVNQRTQQGTLRKRAPRTPRTTTPPTPRTPHTRRWFTEQEKARAVRSFWQTGATATINKLGYPSRSTLLRWVETHTKAGIPRKTTPTDTSTTPRARYTPEFRRKVVDAVFAGMSVRDAAKEYGVCNPPVIYRWLSRARQGKTLDMIPRSTPHDHTDDTSAGVPPVAPATPADNNPQATDRQQSTKGKSDKVTVHQYLQALPDDPTVLKEMLMYAHAELAMVKAAAELKKEEGVDIQGLSNAHKTQIVNAVRRKFPLDVCLQVCQLPSASYYYHRDKPGWLSKYEHLREVFLRIACEGRYTYGSARMWMALKAEGIRISEKVVRVLMKEFGIVVHYGKKRTRAYSSYQGEVTPAVENLVKGNFRPSRPWELLVTDVSEFQTAGGKLYFSPLIDCFDGKVVSWQVSRSADQEFVNRMLDDGARQAGVDRPGVGLSGVVIHSDRGVHYRTCGWLDRFREFGFVRSMSRKGNSGDNAACEGFFGRMKNEMFYPYQWDSPQQLAEAIGQYIDFHNNGKIRAATGLTIAQGRRLLDVA